MKKEKREERREKDREEGKEGRMGAEEKAKKIRKDQTTFSLAPEEFCQWGLPGFASGSLQILDVHFP